MHHTLFVGHTYTYICKNELEAWKEYFRSGDKEMGLLIFTCKPRTYYESHMKSIAKIKYEATCIYIDMSTELLS